MVVSRQLHALRAEGLRDAVLAPGLRAVADFLAAGAFADVALALAEVALGLAAAFFAAGPWCGDAKDTFLSAPCLSRTGLSPQISSKW